MSAETVSIAYYSDLLCIWAYVAQIKVDELRRNFLGRVNLDYRFVSIFGDARGRIGSRWATRGGFEGYASHVRDVVEGFDHVEVHPRLWTEDVPASSWPSHLFVKAAALATAAGIVDGAPVAEFEGRTPVEELAWRLRLAFFRDLRDIARLEVQLELAGAMGLPVEAIRARLDDGTAFAALAGDHESAASHHITGSPTFLLNEGRQKLYGNVGYRVIEANVQECLRDNRDVASWC